MSTEDMRTKEWWRRYVLPASLGGVLFLCFLYYQLSETGIHQERAEQQHGTLTNASQTPLSLDLDMAAAQQRNRECEIKTRIAYLKVHKTASSTFANILKHFGYIRNLTFAIPANGSTHFSHFHSLKEQYIERIPADRPVDILFHHVVYDRNAWASVLPSDAVYIASVREPMSWFISAFLYYRYDARVANTLKVHKMDTEYYIRQYLRSPSMYENDLPIYRALDRMPFDFGIPKEKLRDMDFIKRYLTNVIDKDFRLVLLSEHFDESLVLLKRILCWELKDIFFISRMISSRNKPPELSLDLIMEHKRRSPATYLMYDHFKSNFFQMIEAQGPTFFSEVRVFRKMMRVVRKFCHSLPTNETRVLFRSKWTQDFWLSGLDCFLMNYTKSVKWLLTEPYRYNHSFYMN